MAQQISEEESWGGRQEPARILVVDDEEQILRLLSHVIWDAGYAVETRADGASARDALGAQRFDLVITDLAMPGLPGEAVLESAKALESPLPVVIITARTTDRDRERLRRLGADEILLKPFRMVDLISVVGRLLGQPD